MKFKPISAVKVIKALEKIGFKAIRQSGSHVILKHNDGRMTVVPVHSSELIGRGLLRKIKKRGKPRERRIFEISRKNLEAPVIAPYSNKIAFSTLFLPSELSILIK